MAFTGHKASLWKVDGDGEFISAKEHGPFDGWTLANYADNRILWRHLDGRISLWKVDDNGEFISGKEHGPFDGWTGLNYADGRILWRHLDGRISLWKVDDNGEFISGKEHGPFDGWIGLNYADGRILWRHLGGRISLWKVDDNGEFISGKEHGPLDGWIGLNYADGRILWRHLDGRISLWKVDDNGEFIGGKEHGPFDGWIGLNYADGRILWRHLDGRISLWKVDDNGEFIGGKEHGPFDGWTGLNYADGRILWFNGANVEIWFSGFKCLDESSEISGSDEPYMFLGVSTSGEAQTPHETGVFSVDKGKVVRLAKRLYSGPAQDVILAVAIREQDHGDPHAFSDIFKAVLEVGNAALASQTGGVKVPGEVVKFLSDKLSSLVGAADDDVGRRADLLTRDALIQMANQSEGGDPASDFTWELGSDSEGRYRLYFFVREI